ncbi:uncharacterized protein BDR25DRAFT_85418 [Lindgomyces ingoldianus]|uniref:Uncharacterized protein n=1 Tax=Lindgomyces ingoldianus TaxID=673940 RepID=A0ACB6QGV7_9PLEO|nr:uncharacterized protein BDR25DRAFT_85418 [Lindgomyces ingoldianus]KAF2465597.1 hypothetical protein BDR25DRAFT_85418 [Lindgomyces ingoldianus]
MRSLFQVANRPLDQEQAFRNLADADHPDRIWRYLKRRNRTDYFAGESLGAHSELLYIIFSSATRYFLQIARAGCWCMAPFIHSKVCHETRWALG